MRMTNCKDCNQELSKKAKTCPNCGKDQRNFFMRHKIITAILVIIIISTFGTAGKDEPEELVKDEVIKEEIEEGVDLVEVDEKDVEEEEDGVPREHKAALNKAKVYSDTMHMSKAGIYDQLVSEYGENFPVEAADYAMEKLDSDWNNNALKKAETYSDTMDMSKAGIYDQLTSEHGEAFEPQEAQYAIDNIVADWNENALKKAKVYANEMNMSNNSVYDQLISDYGEKFTADQAQYAVDNLE